MSLVSCDTKIPNVFYTLLQSIAQNDPGCNYALVRQQYQGWSGNTHRGVGHCRSSKSADNIPHQPKLVHHSLTPSRGVGILQVSPSPFNDGG